VSVAPGRSTGRGFCSSEELLVVVACQNAGSHVRFVTLVTADDLSCLSESAGCASAAWAVLLRGCACMSAGVLLQHTPALFPPPTMLHSSVAACI
jgi:hypothetical protein